MSKPQSRGSGNTGRTRTDTGQPSNEATPDLKHRRGPLKPCVMCRTLTDRRWEGMPLCWNKLRGKWGHRTGASMTRGMGKAQSATPGPSRKPGDGPVRIVRAANHA